MLFLAHCLRRNVYSRSSLCVFFCLLTIQTVGRELNKLFNLRVSFITTQPALECLKKETF